MLGSGQRTGFQTKTIRKAVLAVTAAAIIASSMTMLAGARALPAQATFADRFVMAVAAPADCTVQAWPYFDSRCLRRDDNKPIHPVRMIAIDRVN
jgi:hypothetical protein